MTDQDQTPHPGDDTGDDTEGHGRRDADDTGDDTEGHGRRDADDTGDDIKGQDFRYS